MTERLSERLSNDDFNGIVAIVIDLPHFDTPTERRDGYLQPAFQGRRGAEVIRRDAPVQGERATAAPALVVYLARTYGAIEEDVESLGVFLAYAAGRAPAHAAEIGRLIDAYGMLDGDPELRDRLRSAGRAKGRAGAPRKAGPAAALEGDAWPGPLPDASGFETMVRQLTDLPAAFLEQGRRTSRSVALIKVKFPAVDATGTGFLIGADLMLTCHHVLFDHEHEDAPPTSVEAWFNYETDTDDRPARERVVAARVDTIAGDKTHDWAVIRLAEPLPADFTPLPLSARPAARGTRALIVQHPGGGYKRLDFGDNPIWYVDDDVVQYFLNTEAGSSGAPVFNERWEVVALHHKWGRSWRWRGLREVTYNQGVSVGRVREGLVDQGLLPAVSLRGTAEGERRPATTDRSVAEGAESAVQPTAGPWDDYLRARVAHWTENSDDPHIDRQFTNLTLQLDAGRVKEGGLLPAAPEPFTDLYDVLLRVAREPDCPAVVVLGEPGAGKSILLKRLELDLATRCLAVGGSGHPVPSAPLPLLVDLRDHQASPLAPRAWLAEQWAERTSGMPPFEETLGRRGVVVLLDGLNEINEGNPDAFNKRVKAWSDAVASMHQARLPVQWVFACRSQDYPSAPLGGASIRVPEVTIQRLDDGQIQVFLANYAPAHAATLWAQIKDDRRARDLYSAPIYLRLLTLAVATSADGTLPMGGRAALFTWFLRARLWTEVVDRRNARFVHGDQLTADDRARIRRGKSDVYDTPYDLPADGSLIDGLTRLADQTMRLTARRQGPWTVAETVGWLGSSAADARALLEAGAALRVLELRQVGRQFTFAHQLFQEYFAARAMAAAPDAALLYSPWRTTGTHAVAVNVASILPRLGKEEPLPQLPSTGWEEVAPLAAEMMIPAGADAFIRDLERVNVPIAGRCAAVLLPPAAGPIRERVAKVLFARMQDAAADVRARIAAGLALGDLGAIELLGFERRSTAEQPYVMPPLHTIPSGSYPIGDDDSRWDDEKPAHLVRLAGFRISRYPVTNAEYRCFIEAGGYREPRWWQTPDARRWLAGEREWVDRERTLMLELFDFKPEQLTAESVEVLDEMFPVGARTGPFYWNNPAFRNPLQPVIGVSWYEARAYCSWLGARSGVSFELLSEVQLEAATRGRNGRAFAYGNEFDPSRCNTAEHNLRSTSPVAVFPGGDTHDGIVDLTGNVWQWTRSLWGTDGRRIDDEFLYPYDPSDDTREDPTAPPECLRVVRGGSWSNLHVSARAAYRDGDHPSIRGNNLGFRLVVSSPILS